MAKYNIAGIIVEMNTFGRTEEQAAAYLADPDSDYEFTVLSRREDLKEGNPNLTDDEAEYLATGTYFYRSMIRYGGILLHSSCVVVDGKAYLFTAPCGTGKSTHTQLWLKLFGDRAFILNDDKPVIRVIRDKCYVYGTPWSGKHNLQRNFRAELGGIAVLRRAEENSIRKMDPADAVFELLGQTARSKATKVMLICMETIGKIVSTGKVYELFCNMDISAAKLSYETMSEKRFSCED